MSETLETYLSLTYETSIRPEISTEGTIVYLGVHPELPGCMAHGRSVEDARSSLDEAKRLYISSLIKRGQPVPLPSTSPDTFLMSRQN